MKSGIQNSTFRLAFCAVTAALEVVLMMITGVVPVGTYAFPCFAGALTLAIVIEYGWKWALGVFGVAAVLSALFAADKEAVLYFIAIFGYYPILKNPIERRIKNRIVQYEEQIKDHQNTISFLQRRKKELLKELRKDDS